MHRMKYAGCNVDAYTISDRKKKNDFLEKISEKIKVTSETVGEATGTDRILRSTAMKDSSSFEKNLDTDKDCNKDTTGLVTMNVHSRGHLFFVTSGGIIRYWSPLYKSESTSQVAIPTIKYCELYLKEYRNIDDKFLFYDNMVGFLCL